MFDSLLQRTSTAVIVAALATAVLPDGLSAQTISPAQPSIPAGTQQAATQAVPSAIDPFTLVAPARAAAAGSRVRLENTRDELNDFVRIQRMLFENSAGYLQSLVERQRAYATFDAARTATLTALDSDPEARQTRLLVADSSRLIELHRARIASRPPNTSVSPEDATRLDALLAHRLSLSQRLGGLETQALTGDKSVRESRTALVTANARVDAMRRDFELRLRTGPELASARRTVREAREDTAAATVYANQTARTADLLLDYAYYVQWISLRRPYVINSPFISYGFPINGFNNSFFNTGPNSNFNQPSTGIGFGNIPYQGQ